MFYNVWVRAVIKFMIFNVHVMEHVYNLTYNVLYKDNVGRTSWTSSSNNISNYLQMEIPHKCYTTTHWHVGHYMIKKQFIIFHLLCCLQENLNLRNDFVIQQPRYTCK